MREGRVYLDGYGVVSLRQRAGGVPLALFIVPLHIPMRLQPQGRIIGYGSAACGMVWTSIETGGFIPQLIHQDASGKTALALHMARRIPGPTLYVDADGGLSPYILNGQDLYISFGL